MRKIYLIFGLIFGLQTIANAQFTCGDIVVDSGGSTGDYSNDEIDTITICPGVSTDAIQLIFSSFELEDTYDFLYIYDANGLIGTPIASYTGLQTIANITAENPTGCLTLLFTSDISITAPGFEAIINCVPEPTCPRPTSLIFSNTTDASTDFSWTNGGSETSWNIEYGVAGFTLGSGTQLTASTNPYTLNGLTGLTNYDVYISATCSPTETSTILGPVSFSTTATPLFCGDIFMDSGSDTDNYSVNEDYNVTICPTVGSTVQLVFSAFNIENGYDFMTIYDNNSASGTQIGVYTGTTSPGTIVAENPTGCLTVNFLSDDIISAAGWIASVNCVAPVTCFTPTNVTLNSNTDLTGTVSWIAGGTETQWLVEYGTTGFTQGSGTEVLTSNNPYTISGLSEFTNYDVYIRAFCGGTDTSFYSTVLSFTTDMTPLAPFICGNLFTDAGGINGNYSANTQDTIVICPSASGDMVSLVFSEYNTESNYDTLFIYDGNSTAGNLIIALDSIQTPGTITATNSTGCLTAVFSSDGTVQASGWSAIIDCPAPPTCAAPSSLSASNVGLSSASLNWISNGNETAWTIEYGPAGFPQGSGTVISSTSNSLSVGGLNQNTTYNFYVTAMCSVSDSATSSVGVFTTLNNAGFSELEINSLSISPNPSNGKFVITNKSGVSIKAELFDAQGRKLNLNLSALDSNKELSIDASNFDNGVYFLKTESALGNRTYSLVKN